MDVPVTNEMLNDPRAVVAILGVVVVMLAVILNFVLNLVRFTSERKGRFPVPANGVSAKVDSLTRQFTAHTEREELILDKVATTQGKFAEIQTRQVTILEGQAKDTELRFRALCLELKEALRENGT